MAYIVYIVLFHYMSCFILSSFSLYFSATILFTKKIHSTSTNLSLLMRLYFFYAFFMGITFLLSTPYNIIYWRDETVIYDARILYWLNIVPFTLCWLNSIIEIFLCVDRCFFILFPFKYEKKYQISVMTLSIIVLTIVASFLINEFRSLIPQSFETNCRFFGCFLKDATLFIYTKNVFVILSIFATLTSILIFKKVVINAVYTKRNNRVLLLIISATVSIECIPLSVDAICRFIIGTTLSVYIGPYAPTNVLLTITVSSILYHKAFRKVLKISNVPVVT